MRAQVTLADLLERPDLEPALERPDLEPARDHGRLQLFVPAPAQLAGQRSMPDTNREDPGVWR